MPIKDQSSSTGKSYLNLVKEYQLLLMIFSFVLLTALITYILYIHTTELLKSRLQDRLIAIASTAAVQFDADDIKAIKGPESVDNPVFEKLVNQLKGIKEANANIQFSYLMRRTEDLQMLEFVADALSLAPQEELDANKNGTLEVDELAPQPGDPYDIDPYPVLRDEAFYHPAVDRNLQSDQWGLIMSAYAPIFDDQKNTVAIVGLDVLVDDFRTLTQATLLPFLLFILFLIFLLFLLTFILMRVYTQRVEAVKELDRQKDELLGIVAHQLAKPVTAIKWDLESFLDGDLGQLTSEQHEEAITMKAQAINLADLVSMILDVSRIQLGKINLEPQPLDLNQLFKEMLDVIEPTIKQKKLNFVKNMPASLPIALLDKRYTRMTIENLLTNATKYTPDGGTVKLDVSITNGMMHCSVSDTGCGIPKEEQSKIFGKMYRASNVRNTVEGNGFGLYVAKGAIEGQGGKMWFMSEVGKGTTFFFDLPIKEPEKSTK